MNWSNLTANGLSSLLDVLIVTIFYRRWLEIRNNRYISVIFPVALIVVMIFFTTLANKSFAVPIVVFELFTLYALTFKGRFTSRLFASMTVFGVMIISELISGVLLMSIHKGNLDYIHNNIIFYMQGVILSKLFVFTICKIIGFFEERDISIINIKTVVCLIIITASSIISIYYIAMYVYNTNGIISSTMALFLTLLIISAFICTFFVFDTIIIAQKEKTRTELEKRQYKNEIEHYNQLNLQQIEIRRLNHDMVNILTGLSGAIKADDTDSALRKINAYLLKCEEYRAIDCGNSAVDALLNSKKTAAENESILFEYEAIIPNLKIDEIDFCIMLGNILDNAIESCMRIDDFSKRKIFIRIRSLNSMLSVHCENSAIGENAGLKTAKSDKKNHGFGVRKIREVAEDYDGYAKFERVGDVFVTDVVVRNEEMASSGGLHY